MKIPSYQARRNIRRSRAAATGADSCPHCSHGGISFTFEASNVHRSGERRRFPVTAIRRARFGTDGWLERRGLYGGIFEVRGVHCEARGGSGRGIPGIIRDYLLTLMLFAQAKGAQSFSIRLDAHPDLTHFGDYEPRLIWEPKGRSKHGEGA